MIFSIFTSIIVTKNTKSSLILDKLLIQTYLQIFSNFTKFNVLFIPSKQTIHNFHITKDMIIGFILHLYMKSIILFLNYWFLFWIPYIYMYPANFILSNNTLIISNMNLCEPRYTNSLGSLKIQFNLKKLYKNINLFKYLHL